MWEDPASKARAAILAVPELGPLFGRMQGAHAALALAAQPPEEGRLKLIVEEQFAVDQWHDTIIRGLYNFFGALADLLGDDDAAPMLALRDKLIPDGLSSMQKTYRAEAGQAAQLQARLTPEVRVRAAQVAPRHTQAFTTARVSERTASARVSKR